MTYIAACLGLSDEFNYQFFNCYSGDSVTQVFSKDPYKNVWYFSNDPAERTNAGLERNFRAIGYSFKYITGITDENRAEWLMKIRESLDAGLPVMARGGNTDGLEYEFNCIVGYDNDNENAALLYLMCDKDRAESVAKDMFRELVFIGEKVAEPVQVGEAYREAVMRIPELLNMPETDTMSFGVQAFYDWAKQLSDGSLANFDNQWHNVWSVHGTYLCMLGSNGFGFGILDKAQQYNSDMAWLDEIRALYSELQEIFEILAYRDGGICGGFDMKPEDVRVPEKMQPVCEKILQAAEITTKIAETILNHK